MKHLKGYDGVRSTVLGVFPLKNECRLDIFLDACFSQLCLKIVACKMFLVTTLPIWQKESHFMFKKKRHSTSHLPLLNQIKLYSWNTFLSIKHHKVLCVFKNTLTHISVSHLVFAIQGSDWNGLNESVGMLCWRLKKPLVRGFKDVKSLLGRFMVMNCLMGRSASCWISINWWWSTGCN